MKNNDSRNTRKEFTMSRSASCIVVVLLAAMATATLWGGECQLKWSTVDMGGGVSSSGNHRIVSSIQPVVFGSNLNAVVGSVKALEVAENAQGKGNELKTGISTVYPNPCLVNGATKISYSLARDGNVSVQVYDLSGKLVKSLVNDNQQAGSHRVSFNANSTRGQLARGIYFVKLITDGDQVSRKLVLK
jgi:hypothetical protein